MTGTARHSHSAPLAHASLWSLTRRSFGWCAQRTFVSVALGAATVLSMLAMCCGVGLVTAPWFLAEMLAVLLTEAHGSVVVRTKSWIAAASVLLAAQLLVAASAWLTTLAFQTQVPTDTSNAAAWLLPPHLASLAIALITTVLALAMVVPLFYAPLILLDRGGNVGGALLESVRLVIHGGFLRHLTISLVSHTIQAAPLWIAALVATAAARTGAIPVALLIGAPFVAASLPLGQGLFVAAYSDARPHLTDPRRTRASGRPPRNLILAASASLLAPIVAVFGFGGSLIRPSHLAPVEVLNGEVIADVHLADSPRATVYPPGTTLEITASSTHAHVVAGDGGGAGTLPLRSSSPVERLRVLQAHDQYAIELTQAGTRYATFINRAGVRQDDDLRARLDDRAPAWAVALMLGTLALALFLLGPPVYQLAVVRRLYTLPGTTRPPAHEIAKRRDHAVRHGYRVCLALLPAIAASLYWSLRALLGS